MSTEARRTRRRTGENRERLLKSALTLFGDYGFHGTSTELIGRHADVPQPHLYANFVSKQELFVTCVETVVTRAVDCAPELPVDEECRLIFQAFAAARTAELSEHLVSPLAKLQRAHTPTSIARLLERAAASLVHAK